MSDALAVVNADFPRAVAATKEMFSDGMLVVRNCTPIIYSFVNSFNCLTRIVIYQSYRSYTLLLHALLDEV